jgi:hypothetical protein
MFSEIGLYWMCVSRTLIFQTELQKMRGLCSDKVCALWRGLDYGVREPFADCFIFQNYVMINQERIQYEPVSEEFREYYYFKMKRPEI